MSDSSWVIPRMLLVHVCHLMRYFYVDNILWCEGGFVMSVCLIVTGFEE